MKTSLKWAVFLALVGIAAAQPSIPVTNLNPVATASIVGRNTAGTGRGEVLTATNVRSILGLTTAGAAPTANVVSFLTAADYSAMRTQLGLVIGTNVQAYDADLTTWAGITPGANVGTALAVAVGSAGAFVTFNGAGGTPSSLTLTNATGLPVAGGGTGATTLTGLVYGNGTSAFTAATGTQVDTAVEHSISFSVSGGGSAITTGVQDIIASSPYGGTFTRWIVTVSPADTITFDILRSADGGAAPSASVVGGSGTKPNVASGVQTHSTTFTSWTSTTATPFDNWKCQITAVGGTATAATVTLYFR